MKLFVSFRLLDLGQSAGLIGQDDQLVARPLLTAPGDCDDGEIGGMNDFGMGNRSTRRKSAPTPLCPPQIPGANSGRSGGKTATNHLSYGAALEHIGLKLITLMN
jgi:hypothetical protein